MTLKNVANEDMEVKFTNTAGPTDLKYGGDLGIDTVEIVPTLSPNCKAKGKKVATKGVTITWTAAGCAFTSVSHTFVSGVGAITPQATKTKADGELPLRKGDEDTGGCKGGWTLTAFPFTAVPCVCDTKVSSPGQTKDKAQ